MIRVDLNFSASFLPQFLNNCRQPKVQSISGLNLSYSHSEYIIPC